MKNKIRCRLVVIIAGVFTSAGTMDLLTGLGVPVPNNLTVASSGSSIGSTLAFIAGRHSVRQI